MRAPACCFWPAVRRRSTGSRGLYRAVLSCTELSPPAVDLRQNCCKSVHIARNGSLMMLTIISISVEYTPHLVCVQNTVCADFAIQLAVVSANSGSHETSYARHKRIFPPIRIIIVTNCFISAGRRCICLSGFVKRG